MAVAEGIIDGMGVLKVPASVPPVRSPAPNEPAVQVVVVGVVLPTDPL